MRSILRRPESGKLPGKAGERKKSTTIDSAIHDL